MRWREPLLILTLGMLVSGCGQAKKAGPPEADEVVLNVPGMT